MVSYQTKSSGYSGIGNGTKIVGGFQILNIPDKTISSRIGKIKAEVLSVINKILQYVILLFSFTVIY